MLTAKEVIVYMESLQNEKQRQVLMRFFKTGPGEYGEGDEFLGLKVPQTREVVRAVWQDFPLSEVPELLMNRWHEVRLCGLLILVAKFEKLATKRLENDEAAIRGRDEILTMYLGYAEQANNWDLVDLSVHKILGHWLLLPTKVLPLAPPKGKGRKHLHPDIPPIEEGDSLQIAYKRQVLDELAQSNNLWKQRMSMVCTWKTSQKGDPSWCLRYAEIHLHHLCELKQKAARRGEKMSYAERERVRLMSMAVGWMLREMGKRCSMDLLRDFLRQHAHEMPRIMLRYAIEKMPEEERAERLKS